LYFCWKERNPEKQQHIVEIFFLSMVLSIFAVLYLVNFVSFVGVALASIPRKCCKDNFLGAIR